MFFSTYFFYVFSLTVRIAALYFYRLFRKTFCALFLDFKSRVFFSLLLYRYVCFLFYFYEVESPLCYLSPSVIYFWDCLIISFINWLSSLWILSWLPSDFSRGLIISFLWTLHVACLSLLFADCTTIFSVLLIASQYSKSNSMIITADLIRHYFPAYLFYSWAFLLMLWYQCCIRYLYIPDILMIVRSHLPLGIQDSIIFPRQFLSSVPWLKRTIGSILHLYPHNILCYVAMLGNAYYSAWIYDPLSNRCTGSIDWWRRNFFGWISLTRYESAPWLTLMTIKFLLNIMIAAIKSLL